MTYTQRDDLTYSDVLTMIESYMALADNDYSLLSNMSNLSSIIQHNVKDISWAGFYLNDSGILKLGPFSGEPACTAISFDRGVCGYSATTKEIVIVDDVSLFKGHIACSSVTKSEAVLPLLRGDGTLFGVFDLDSPCLSRFDQPVMSFLIKALNIFVSFNGVANIKGFD